MPHLHFRYGQAHGKWSYLIFCRIEFLNEALCFELEDFPCTYGDHADHQTRHPCRAEARHPLVRIVPRLPHAKPEE
jgi:hypothetical protein